MRYKIDLIESQSREVEKLVKKYHGSLKVTKIPHYPYHSIELTKTFISRRLNPGDEEMSRVLVDCFILKSYNGEKYVYKEDALYNEKLFFDKLLKFMTPYIREYKIDKIL